jgi:hypothetical protein
LEVENLELEAERHKKVVLPPRPKDDPEGVDEKGSKPPEPEMDPPEPRDFEARQRHHQRMARERRRRLLQSGDEAMEQTVEADPKHELSEEAAESFQRWAATWRISLVFSCMRAQGRGRCVCVCVRA